MDISSDLAQEIARDVVREATLPAERPSPDWTETATALAEQAIHVRECIRRSPGREAFLREREAMRREAQASLMRRSCKGS